MKKSIIVILTFMLCSVTLITPTGCKKDCTNTTVHDSTTIVNHDTVTNTQWVMEYNEQAPGTSIYYAPQTFISTGLAKAPSNIHHGTYWVTNFNIQIPKEINLNIDTDSLKLVANIRNVLGDGIANEIDLSLLQSSSFMAFASWQKGSNPTYCRLGVTGQLTGNIPEMLTDPSSYAEYAISIQGNQVTSYKNSTVLKSVSYTGTIGKLFSVGVLFRGFGEIDWVKLYKGNKLIMIENFNIDGTTTALWSKP